jgi:hypothetical protein
MRSLAKQKRLDSLSQNKKFTLTSIESYKSRWSLIEEYKYWYISNNEVEHQDRWDFQIILRRKDRNVNFLQSFFSMMEFLSITNKYDRYNIIRHGKWWQSVKKREHRHIFSDK